MASISVTENKKGFGYSKELIGEYFKVLSENKAKSITMTEYSEEGEKFLDSNITILSEDYNLKIKFEKESEFEKEKTRGMRR